ncbi:MAG TPA: transporter [Casimicrobiaceae bacterium]
MATKRRKWMQPCVVAIAIALPAGTAQSGAPFQTDDPGVVGAGRVELLVFDQVTLAGRTRSGSAPGVEWHWGVRDGTEIDVTSALASSASSDTGTRRGYGDTTIGLKYRLVPESVTAPLVSLVPKVTFATGSAARGLGNGGNRLLLGVAIQKEIAAGFVTYANAAYTFNNGRDNRDFWFAGWVVQRQLSPEWVVGAELFATSAQAVGHRGSTGVNVGGYYLFDPNDPLLFSLGRGVANVHETNRVSSYIGYQRSF